MAIQVNSSPKLIDGTTMIPVDVIAKAFNCDASYQLASAMITVSKDNFVTPEVLKTNYNTEDLLWLARIVTVEARNLSMKGKIAIANVVLNRKKSTLFPNTIYDVIFQIDYHVQFPPAHRSSFRDSTPSTESIKAAIIALDGYNNISNCLYFNNSPFRSKADDLYKVIEGEYFYH